MYPDYEKVIRDALYLGRVVAPRDDFTHEYIGPMTVAMPTGQTVKRRGMNTKLGLIEGLMLVAGRFDPRLIKAVAPKVDMGLFTHQSAYGPRADRSIHNVIRELLEDRYSRRAVVHIADDPNQAGTADLPCTLSIQFMMRESVLDTYVTMRSWDLVWGLPHDLIQFHVLSLAVQMYLDKNAELGCGIGTTYVTANSAHMYQSTRIEPHEAKQGPMLSLNYETWYNLCNFVAERQTWTDVQAGAFLAAQSLAAGGDLSDELFKWSDE